MLAKEASQWRIEARPELQQIRNLIREVVERLSFQLCPGRDLIELTLGDPTRCGELPPHPDVPQAVSEVVLAGGNNGYQTARGSLEARQAIADKHTTPEGPLHAENVFLTNGCSGEFSRIIELFYYNFSLFRGDPLFAAGPLSAGTEPAGALSRIRALPHHMHLSGGGGASLPPGPRPLLRGGSGGPGESDRRTDRRYLDQQPVQSMRRCLLATAPD